MKKQVVRISILQSSKVAAALYAFMGLFYSLIGIPMILFGNTEIRIMGVIYLFMPILMAGIGFVFFCLFTAIYNLVAGWIGGFEVEVLDIP